MRAFKSSSCSQLMYWSPLPVVPPRKQRVMPAKVYLDSPPGDFRAMPARGSGVALLKWVTSYPHNPERDLPVVTGVIVLSDADSGGELAILDARSVTWLRTGAASAKSFRRPFSV